jgi:hypothetical protein
MNARIVVEKPFGHDRASAIGDTVIVGRLDGLTLVVEPASGRGSSHRDDVGEDRFRFANGVYERKERHGDK